MAPQGGEQAVQVLDVDLDVLDEQDVALPAELGRRAAVEEVDEGRQVAADGDARRASAAGAASARPSPL
ncbi:MAG: hypothetical protein M0C28_45380 [Candidatus Moduliflexus flocculans]|nr:hypothetical protein [Candidatus Moduliflexus flocculans]